MKKTSFIWMMLAIVGSIMMSCEQSGNEPNISGPHKAVDLGLPSGLKWADRNVGAQNASKIGSRFCLGVTDMAQNFGYYEWMTLAEDENSIYNTTYQSDNSTLTAQDDAATVKWGNKWRTPTAAEWRELVDNCEIKSTTQNNVSGVTLTGPNGRSIFLPNPGSIESEELDSSPYYWSSTFFFRFYGHCACFEGEMFEVLDGPTAGLPVCYQLPIRPVCQ